MALCGTERHRKWQGAPVAAAVIAAAVAAAAVAAKEGKVEKEQLHVG